ncbi:HipA domain-containing protein, partial [Salipiger sp. P9]|uniref:HipA domain-containing protein n=1 Tax=Salipiger pentaromativorans TaxID=2943193 RepID=UPI0021570DD1
GAPPDPERWSYVPLTAFYDDPDPQRALARHFDDLEQRPFLAGEEGVRLSLAGGQKKTALAVLAPDGTPVLRLPREGDALAVPLNGAPSTVILKPDNPRLPGLTENETYCLHLATAIGIDTARACILSAQDRAAICVLRYDRALTAAGGIRRVHQEDFAQANGLPPGRKYERGSLPGLTLAQLFATRHRLAQPIGDALLDQVLFNVLVANTDAHAKNYSLLFPLNALPGLAPLYDVSTVLPWDGRGGGPRVVQTYAQKLAGKARRPGDLAPRHWERIAGDAGMRASVLRNRIVDMVDRMVAARIATTGTVAQMQGAASGYVAEAAEALEGNALRILGRLTAD